jgi:hypothetical protein
MYQNRPRYSPNYLSSPSERTYQECDPDGEPHRETLYAIPTPKIDYNLNITKDLHTAP